MPNEAAEADEKRRRVAEAVYRAMIKAQRDAGDAALCEALDLLAAGTGENRFRHAASVLRGTVLGRTAINDQAALRRIAAFPPARRREAVGVVARQIAGLEATNASVETIARRLRRKLQKRENETDEMVLSVASAL